MNGLGTEREGTHFGAGWDGVAFGPRQRAVARHGADQHGVPTRRGAEPSRRVVRGCVQGCAGACQR